MLCTVQHNAETAPPSVQQSLQHEITGASRIGEERVEALVPRVFSYSQLLGSFDGSKHTGCVIEQICRCGFAFCAWFCASDKNCGSRMRLPDVEIMDKSQLPRPRKPVNE